jgi:hypothetical protein
LPLIPCSQAPSTYLHRLPPSIVINTIIIIIPPLIHVIWVLYSFTVCNNHLSTCCMDYQLSRNRLLFVSITAQHPLAVFVSYCTVTTCCLCLILHSNHLLFVSYTAQWPLAIRVSYCTVTTCCSCLIQHSGHLLFLSLTAKWPLAVRV